MTKQTIILQVEIDLDDAIASVVDWINNCSERVVVDKPKFEELLQSEAFKQALAKDVAAAWDASYFGGQNLGHALEFLMQDDSIIDCE